MATCLRNFRNSSCWCRGWQASVTLPVATSSAANSVVVTVAHARLDLDLNEPVDVALEAILARATFQKKTSSTTATRSEAGAEGQDGGMTATARFVPVPHRERPGDDAQIGTARAFADAMVTRRTVRDFSPDPVPLEVIRQAVRAAASAPSGAHVQPWRFVLVTDLERKRSLREGAEAEERRFYDTRAGREWLEALAPLGTDWRKPFLEVAPVVLVVFEVHAGNGEPKPYYVKESVGIAVGLLLAALHTAGLATLTHTPSPMRWICEVLGRPGNERPYVVIPIGWPADEALVPDLVRKPLDEVLVEL